MKNAQFLSVGVPILILIVTQLSIVAREMNLEDVASEGRPPFVFWKLEDWPVPTMGRFNFVHGGNTVLLGGTAAFIGLNLNGVAGWSLFLLVGTVWFILPVIEVTEYGLMTDGSQRPFSFLLHTSLVAVALVLVVWRPPLVIGTKVQPRPVATAGYVVILLVGIYAYLLKLQNELRSVSFYALLEK